MLDEEEKRFRKKYKGVFLGPSPLNVMKCDHVVGGFSNLANQQCFSLKSEETEEDLPEDYRLSKCKDTVDRDWMYELFDFK
jgi:hypothetical protein